MCVITVSNSIVGVTIGEAGDFGDPLFSGARVASIAPSSGVMAIGTGTEMQFNFTTGTDLGPIMVHGVLASGENFTSNPFEVVVAGTPTAASELSCVGSTTERGTGTQTVSGLSGLARPNEIVTCTITVNDDAGATAGVATDFGTPFVTGGTIVSPSGGVAGPTSSSSATMTFVVRASSDAGDVLTVVGTTSTGMNFSEDVTEMLVTEFPDIVEWSLDMNNAAGASIEVTFHATTNTTGLNVSKLTIQNTQDASPTESFTLTTSTAGFDATDTTSLSKTFVLSASDTVALKLLQNLGTTTSNTYLSVEEGSNIRDLDENDEELRRLTGSNAIQVSEVNNDVTSPALLTSNGEGFVQFNMNARTFTLAFSEPMDVSTLNISNMYLGPDFAATTARYMLVNSSSTSSDGSQIVIDMGPVDFAAIAADTRQLCSAAGRCVISFDATAILDMEGNEVTPIAAGLFEAYRTPTTLVHDTTGPTLQAFALNMNSAQMSLTFDEVVDPTTFDPTQLTFLSNQSDVISVTLTDATQVVTSSTGTVMVISIGGTDMASLKASELADQATNTYLSLRTGAISDNTLENANPGASTTPSQAINAAAALVATAFTADSTPASLESFSLDLGTKALLVTFDEPILLDALNLTRFTLSGNRFSDRSIHLIEGADSTGGDRTTIVSITLSNVAAAAIRADIGIATNTANTYLALAAGAITDVAGTASAATGNNAAMQATLVSADGVAPQLNSFDLNIDEGTLTLSFDDIMSAASLDASQLTLQNADGTSSRALSASFTNSSDGQVIVITLGITDLNILKANTGLATNSSSSNLLMTRDAFEDPAGQRVAAVSSALETATFTPDGSAGSITSVSMDLNAGFLRVVFDESVDIETFDITQFSLQSTANASALDAISLQLSGNVTQVSNNVIRLAFADDLFDEIRNNSAIGTGTGTAYVSVGPASVRDFVNISVLEIADSEAIQVASFTDDTTAPVLLAYDIDLDANTMTFTFNEPVDASTLDISRITIQDQQGASQTVGLSAASSSSFDGEIISCPLSSTDTNALKANTALATGRSNTWLRMTTGAVRDMFGVNLAAIDNLAAKQVASYTADASDPELEGFTIDLNIGMIRMTFNEPVDRALFVPDSVQLQSTINGSAFTLALAADTQYLLSADGLEMTLVLTNADQNVIRLNTTFGTSSGNTFMSFSNTTVSDNMGNSVVAIGADEGVAAAADPTPDTTPPTLSGFELDLSNGQVVFTYNEPVDVTTVNASKITFQNATDDAAAAVGVTLSEDLAVRSGNGLIVTYTLDNDDLSKIKAETGLCTNAAGTVYAKVETGAISDMAGVGASASATNSAIIGEFETDQTRPSLEGFSLTMSNPGPAQLPFFLHLTFDETMLVSTVDSTQITLLNGQGVSGSANLFVLTGDNGVSRDQNFGYDNSPIITITLLDADILAIREVAPTLLEDRNSSYVAMTLATAADMNNGQVNVVSYASAVQSESHALTMDPFDVESFTLDLDAGQIILRTSNSIWSETVNTARLSLRNAVASASLSMSLSGQASVDDSAGLFQDATPLALSGDVLDALKVQAQFGHNVSHTYLGVTAAFALDQANNTNNVIGVDSALQANLIIPDTTGPALTLTNVSMNQNRLTLSFNEVVDLRTLNLTASIGVQHSASSSSTLYLEDAEVIITNNISRVVVVQISGDQASIIKIDLSLFVNASSSFVTIASHFIEDMAGNQAQPHSGLQATDFVADSTRPLVESWTLNLNTSIITITFDESVTEMDVAGLSLQNSSFGTDEGVDLTGSTSLVSAGTVMRLHMTAAQLRSVQFQRNLCTAVSNCYLAVTNATVIDMVDEPVVAVASSGALQLGTFSDDWTEPMFVSFLAFNLSSAVLTISFSEPVAPESWSPTGVVLQTDSTVPLSTYTLTGGVVSTTDDQRIYDITLPADDTNAIKADSFVCTFRSVCYIRMANISFTDTSRNNYLVNAMVGSRVIDFTYDATSPEIDAFSLDLEAGVLQLTFSETVDFDRLNVSALTIQSSSTSSSVSRRLTGAVSSATGRVSNTIATIRLTAVDIAALKADTRLASAAGSTFLTADTRFITDTARSPNGLVALPSSAALSTTIFTADDTSPTLSSFSVNMQVGQIYLTFDEPMNNSLFSTEITVSNMVNTSHPDFESYNLTGGDLISASSGDTVLALQMTAADIRSIKLEHPDLWAGQASSFISFAASTAEDTAGNEIEDVSATQATGFTSDASRAEFVGFDVNMATGFITLTFSDVLIASTLDSPELTLRASTTGTDITYTLAGTSGTSSPDGYYIAIALSEADKVGIELTDDLFTELNDTYVLFTAGLMDDSFGRDAVAITQAQRANLYIADTVQPTIEAVGFDAGSLTITINMSEPVALPATIAACATGGIGSQVCSFGVNVSKIVIQDSTSNPSAELRLSADTQISISGDLKTLTLVLTAADQQTIRRAEALARTTSSTFLRVDSGLISDFAGNENQNETVTGLPVSFVGDETAPEINGFTFDLDDERIRLNFTEIVNVTSLDLTTIRFQSASGDGSTVNYTLTGGTAVTAGDSRSLVIALTDADVTQIKLLSGLATGDDTTFVAFGTTLLSDQEGNAIVSTNGYAVDDYIADVTAPELSSYSIDMTAETLTMTFTEPIDAGTFDAADFSLQSENVTGGDTDHLTLSGSLGSTDDSDTLLLELDSATVNALKADSDLAVSRSSTFMSIVDGGSITDMAGNTLTAIGNSSAMNAAAHTGDRTDPTLESFTLNLDTFVLALTFSETVNASSLALRDARYRQTGITLESDSNVSVCRPCGNGCRNCGSEGGCYEAEDGYMLAFGIAVATCPDGTYADADGVCRYCDGTCSTCNGPTIDNCTACEGVDVLQLGSCVNSCMVQNGEYVEQYLTGNDCESCTAPCALCRDTTTCLSCPSGSFYFNRTCTAGACPSGTFQSSTTDCMACPVGCTACNSDSTCTACTGGYTLEDGHCFDTCTSTETDLYVTLSGSTDRQDTPSTIVSITLTSNDRDKIVLRTGLCTSSADCHISLESGVVVDNEGNEIREVRADGAMQTAGFTADATPPNLADIELDMNAMVLTLSFDEPMNSSSLDLSGFTLLSNTTRTGAASSGVSGSSSSSANGRILVVDLSLADANAIKEDDNLGVGLNSSFIYVAVNAIHDMSGVGVAATADGPAVQASEFTEDITNPVLTAFNFNSNLGQLTLFFSESVRVSTTNGTFITVANATGLNRVDYPFTGGSLLATSPDDYLTLQLNAVDENQIKAAHTLATSNETLYLSHRPGLIEDMNGNSVDQRVFPNMIAVTTFTSDTTAPEVEAFVLDMNNEEITLVFSETVNVSSIDLDGITLFANTALLGSNVTISTSRTNDDEATALVVISLSTADVNAIKMLPTLAVNLGSSVLRMATNVLADEHRVFMAAATVPATQFFPDETTPRLTSFHLNLESPSENLILTFLEPVDSSTLEITAITLHSESNSSLGESVTLTTSTAADVYATVVAVQFSYADMRSIKLAEDLAEGGSSSFLSYPEGVIEDMVGNNASEVTRQADVFTDDATAPVLNSFSIDYNAAHPLVNFSLTFSEPVNVSTLDVTSITVQELANGTAAVQTLTLTAADFVSVSSDVVAVTPSITDANALKLLTALGVNSSNAFMDLAAGGVVDMAGNGNAAMLQGAGTTSVQSDTTSPDLDSFDLDLTAGHLIMTFNEAVDVDTFNVSEIRIGAIAGISLEQITVYLSSASNLVGGASSGPIQTIAIGESDLNEIKQKMTNSLAVNQITTLLSFRGASPLVNDMAGNTVNAITLGEPMTVTTYTPDAVAPTLREFDLDMETAILTLTFSETVNTPGINASRINIQELSSGGETFALTAASTASGNSSIVEVDLSIADMNAIKQLASLATTTSSTYITLDGAAVQDMTGNPVAASIALGVSTYTPDTSGPIFTSYTLNMNSRTVALTFDEPVLADSLNGSRIQLAASDSTGASTVTLTSGTAGAGNGLVTTFTISVADANSIKTDLTIGVNSSTSYLTILAGGVGDMAAIQNDIEMQGLYPDTYTADTTAAELDSFAVNMNLGRVTLQFDEPVIPASINLTAMLLVASRTAGDTSLVIRGTTDSSIGTQVVVTIDPDDLNALKALDDLFTDQADAFMMLRGELIDDTASNPSASIAVGNALQATIYTGDTTAVSLEFFSFDLTSGRVTLHFSETVEVGTIEPSQIAVQGSDSALVSFALTDSTVVTTDDFTTTVVLSLSASTIRALKLAQVGVARGSTYLTMTNSSIDDSSGRPNEELVNANNALQVAAGNYTGDTVAPELDTFSFNLGGELVLNFTEPLLVSSFNVTQIFVISGANSSNRVQLSNSNLVTDSITADSIVITMGTADLNPIKVNSALATDRASTYIYFAAELADDVSSVAINAILDSAPANADEYTDDSVSPQLSSFSLDMSADVTTLELNFDEPVNASTLDIAGLLFLSDANADVVRLTGGSAFSGNVLTTQITVRLTETDSNALKALGDLAVDQNSTHLAVDANAIYDMAGNGNVAIVSSDPQQSAGHTVDRTNPELDSFSIDINAATITLSFSETVNEQSYDPTKLTIMSNANGTDASFTLTLTGGAVTSPTDLNSSIVTVSIDTADLDDLKLAYSAVTSTADTFVSLATGLINDMTDLASAAIGLEVGQQASDVTRDSTAVTLSDAVFNLDLGILTLTFSEPVHAGSLNPAGVYMQAASSSTEPFSLSGATVSTSAPNGTIVNVTLPANLLDGLRSTSTLATRISNTFVAMLATAVDDMAGNALTAVTFSNALETSGFVADTGAPSLESWDMNLDSQLLQLTFSEAVDADTLNTSAFSLYNMSSPTGATRHRFGDANVSSTSANATIVAISFSYDDTETVKNADLCSSVVNCFIGIENIFVLDTSGNQVDIDDDFLVASSFISDSTNPELDAFHRFNLTTGIITLSFSETVDVDTFNLTAMTLHNYFDASEADSVSVRLTGGTVLNVGNDREVRIELSTGDLNLIKSTRAVCLGRISCWLRYDSSFVEDLTGNSIQAIISISEFTVADNVAKLANIGADIVGPELLDFQINMNSATITLTFDEPVQYNSFEPESRVTLQSVANAAAGTSYTLTSTKDSGVSDFDGTVMGFALNAVDQLWVKANADLAVTLSSSYISAIAGVVTDVFDNSNQVVATTAGINASAYTADQTNPTFSSFISYDNSNGTLVLQYSEPVDLTSFEFSAVTLTNAASNGYEYTLTEDVAASYINSNTKHQIEITMSSTDLNAIRLVNNFLISQATSKVIIANASVNDMVGLPATAGDSVADALSYTVDTEEPDLLFYTVNLTAGSIFLSFSDVADVSSLLVADQFTFQNAADFSVATSTYPLQGGSSNSPDAFGITLTMTASDVNAIKLRENLATNTSNTFVTYTATFIRDAAGVSTIGRSASRGLQAAEVFADSVPPVVVAFSLHMNNHTMALTFDEVVNVASIDLSGITIGTSDGTSVVSLTGGSATRSTDGLVVTVALTNGDILQLQAEEAVGESANSTFLSLAVGTIEDVSGNANVRVALDTPIGPATHTADAQSPTLTEVSIDFGVEALNMTFSEVIDHETLNTSAIMIQIGSNINVDGTSVTLTGGAVAAVSGELTNVVSITFSEADMNSLQLASNLAIGRSTSYVSVTNRLVNDQVGNWNTARAATSALQVTDFVSDTTNIALVQHTLNMDTGRLVLSFSEVAKVSVIDVTELTFQSSGSDSTLNYTLTSTNVFSQGGGRLVTLQISSDDLNELKKKIGLCEARSNSYIMASANLVTDMVNNPMSAVSGGSAQQVAVGGFTGDLTSPTLTAFAVDMDAATLTLNFDETVDVSSLNFSAFTFAAGQSSSTTFRLTNGSTASSDGTQIIIDLDVDDYDGIRADTDLATEQGTTYLFFDAGAFADMFANDVAAVATASAVRSSAHAEDDSSVTFDRFDLDMALSLLKLYFSEPVNASSLDVPSLWLQTASYSRAHNRFALTEPTTAIVSELTEPRSLTLNISSSDLNQLKVRRIGLNAGRTYLTTAAGAVLDNSANPSTARSNGVTALQVTSLVTDEGRPSLTQFTFDLNAGVLSMDFDEAVYEASAAVGDLLMLSQSSTVAAADDSLSFRLTNTSSHVCATCASTQYTSSNCTNEADTVCEDCTPCDSGSYATEGCGVFTDTSCAMCASCASYQYASGGCGGTIDRACSNCSAVPENSYIATACNGTHDSTFAVCTACLIGQFISTSCSNTADTVCTTYTTVPSNNYVTETGNATSDVSFTTCAACGSNQFQVRDCDAQGDRVCKDCSVPGTAQFASAACNSTADTVLAACTVCDADEFMATACTTTADTVCTACSPCTSNQFINTWCSATADTECISCGSGCASCGDQATCLAPATNHVLYQGTAIPVIPTISGCPEGTYQDSDRHCQECHPTCGTVAGGTCSGPGINDCTNCPEVSVANTDGSGSCINSCMVSNGAYRPLFLAPGDTSCSSCTDVSNCNLCMGTSANQCINCAAGAMFYHGTCTVGGCPVGSYQASATDCAACPAGCAQCDASGTCSECLDGLYLDGGICVQNCNFRTFRPS
jgi:hypothetical protein